MTSLLKSTVGFANALFGSNKKAQSLESMIEGHVVTTTNPFSDIQAFDIGWDEWATTHEEELQTRPSNFFSMEELGIIADKVNLRKQAKALDPNTKDHYSITLPHGVLFFGGSYYKTGGCKIFTDTKDVNEFGEVCPKNSKDGSFKSAHLPYDHPNFHELLDFGFKAVKAKNWKDARTELAHIYTINFEKVGLPFWNHTHPQQQQASTPGTQRKKAPPPPVHGTPQAAFVGYAVPGDENELSPKLPPMPSNWQGNHGSWLEFLAKNAIKSERKAHKELSSSKQDMSELCRAQNQYAENDAVRAQTEKSLAEHLISQADHHKGEMAEKDEALAVQRDVIASLTGTPLSTTSGSTHARSRTPTPKYNTTTAKAPPKAVAKSASSAKTANKETPRKRPVPGTLSSSRKPSAKKSSKTKSTVYCAIEEEVSTLQPGVGVIVKSGKHEGKLGDVNESYDPNDTSKTKIPVVLHDYPDDLKYFFRHQLDAIED